MPPPARASPSKDPSRSWYRYVARKVPSAGAVSCVSTATDVANCGTCAHACTGGQTCAAGVCSTAAPANDLPNNATVIALGAPSQTITGTTTNSTNQSGCNPGGGGTAGDVFYRFTLTAREVVYVDTFTTGFDTALAFATSAGTAIAGTCTDDSCGGVQTQIARVFDPGTYLVVVTGYAAASGPFTLHFQHLAVGNGTPVQITSTAAGMQTFNGTTAGTGVLTESCRPAPGPDNSYWFMTCPAFAATNVYASTVGSATCWDTVVEQRSAARTVNLCNDDTGLGTCGVQSTVTGVVPAGAGLSTINVDGFGTTSMGAYTLIVDFGACTGTQSLCGTTCVDLNTNTSNCGSCGVATPVGGVCTAGVAGCAAGQTNCSGTCRNLQTDTANCGGCGVTVPVGGVCTAGVPGCPTGQTNCGGTCRALQTDNANCGACGTVCSGANTCQAGNCRPANDLIAGAIVIPVTTAQTTLTGTTVNSTNQAACGSGGDVFYRFTLTGREAVYADTYGAAYDTEVGFANSTGTLIAGTCNDDSCGGVQSQTFTELDAGTYYVVVSGFGGTTGAFNLRFQHLAIGATSTPAGQLGAGATTLSATTTTTSPNNNVGCGYGAGPGTWWYWLTCPGAAAGTLTATTCSRATFDTTLGLRNGDGTGGGCNDDACGVQSTLSAAVSAGPGFHALFQNGYSTAAYGAYTIAVTRP